MNDKVAIIRKIETIRNLLQEVQDSVSKMDGLKETLRSLPNTISSQLLDLKLEIEDLILKISRKELKNYRL